MLDENLVFHKDRLLTPVAELQDRIAFTKGKFAKWSKGPEQAGGSK